MGTASVGVLACENKGAVGLEGWQERDGGDICEARGEFLVFVVGLGPSLGHRHGQ
jgi:hypothetical protein